MPRTRSFVLGLALALAACRPGPAATSSSSPTAAAATQLPLVLRDLALASGSPWPHELLQRQVEVRASVARDLLADGPFRAPRPGERPYVLDVWIPALTRDSGAAVVFQLYAPSGTHIFEDRLVAEYRRRNTDSLVVAEIVATFKHRIDERRDRLRRGDWARRAYTPQPAMLALARYLDPAPSQQLAPVARPAPRPTATPSPAPASTPSLVSAAPQPATFVLTIGIDRYRDAPHARGAEADAARVDALFADTFNVPARQRRLLLGERATRTDIHQGLQWLADASRRGARVVVYFSGHGTPHPTTGAPQLVPFEADPADLSRVSLPLADVEHILGRIPARDRLLIVDAGFTGQGPRSLATRGVRPLTLVDPPSPVIRLVAASAGEPVAAAPDADAGLFTHYLLSALGHARADADGDGQITLAELESWLVPRVHAAARNAGAPQTPSFSIGPRGPARDDVILGWGYPVQ